MSELDRSIRTLDALVASGLLQEDAVAPLRAIEQRYAIALTPQIAGLIERSDSADPIARQFLPDLREGEVRPDESADPIGDAKHSPVPGIVHRYPDRALLKLTHLCPVYCRFCFRREMVGPGKSDALTDRDLDAAFAWIATTPALWEIIVTGGDPLVLSPRRLRAVSERLAAIPHVRIVRWHTRVPVVDPPRITGDLVAALAASGKATYVGIHANHPRELSPDAREAITRLADAGLALLSQTVLLRGVNDDAAVLAELFRAFIECRVQPYYLHHLDAAPGTSHFRVPLSDGQALMWQLRGRLSGLAQPTYVIDIPGGHGKVPIGPAYLDRDGCITDPWGEKHTLTDR